MIRQHSRPTLASRAWQAEMPAVQSVEPTAPHRISFLVLYA